MATRIVTRQASQTPSRLLPFLHKQNFSEPNVEQGVFFDDHSQEPRVPLGFPPRTDAERCHGSLFFFNNFSAQSALSPPLNPQLQTQIKNSFFNKFSPWSAWSPHLEAQLQTHVQKLESDLPLLFKLHSASEALWNLSNFNYLPPSLEVDEVILPSHHEDTTSPMLMSTKRTFNPSTIVRKRRHGFLARKATVGGRRILARRFLKGRRRLSA